MALEKVAQGPGSRNTKAVDLFCSVLPPGRSWTVLDGKHSLGPPTSSFPRGRGAFVFVFLLFLIKGDQVSADPPALRFQPGR